MAARSDVGSRWGLAGMLPVLLVMAWVWLAIACGLPSPADASSSSPTVVDQVDGQATLLGVDGADGFSAGIKVSLNSAALSYQSPQDVAPSGPGKAFVAFSMTDEPVDNPTIGDSVCPGSFGDFPPLPGDRVTVALADGTSIATQHLGPTDRASTGSGLLYGTYFAEVPANMTAAHLVIAPGDVDGTEFQGCSGNDATVSFATPVSFALSFAKLPPDTVPSPVTAAQANNQTASANQGGGGDSGGPVGAPGTSHYGPVATALALVVAALIIGAFLYGRRPHPGPVADAGGQRGGHTDWTLPAELQRPVAARSQGRIYTARFTSVADRTPTTQFRRDTKLTGDTKVSTDVAGWTHRTVPHVVEGVEENGSGIQEVADRAVALGPAAGANPPASNGGASHAGSVGSSGGDGASPDEDGGQPLPAVLVGVLGPVKVTGWAKAPRSAGPCRPVGLLGHAPRDPGQRRTAGGQAVAAGFIEAHQ